MRVMIAVDGTAPGVDACRLAARLLVPGRDDVRVITVLSYELFPTSLVPGEHLLDEDRARAVVRDEVERMTGDARRVLEDAHFKPTVVHRFGYPADEIAAEVDHWEPDLVVLGRRGVHGVERVLGSVSERVLHRVRGPAILIVP